jgi:hypothetical protein
MSTSRPSNRSPLTTDETTAAWAFVTEHYAAISKRAWRLASADQRLEGDELFAEAVVFIVRNHRSFDASLSPAEHWIYLLVRRARQDMLEKLNRRREREVPLSAFARADAGPIAESDSPVLTDGGGEAAATHARSRIAQALRRADHEARACAQSVLDEHSDTEARDFLGGGLASRRSRVLRQLAS